MANITIVKANSHILCKIEKKNPDMYVQTFIYRSYIYQFDGHLIPPFISIELWPNGYDGGLVSWRPYRGGGLNPNINIFW